MPDTLFDTRGLAGESLRDEALKRVEENANKVWVRAAGMAVLGVCRDMATFTTDDVWDRLRGHYAETHEPRAMGAVMRWAVREGLCEPTGRYEKSSRPECHARPVRVWRSKVSASWHELPDGKR